MMMGRPQRSPFWDEQCPRRGTGLQHRHETDCKAHVFDECCECEMTEAVWTARREFEMRETGADPEPVTDHLYIYTMAGGCGRRGCGLSKSLHPQYLESGPDPMTECPINHSTIKDKGLLVGEHGAERQFCPSCHVMIEPKLATGEPVGPKWGRGRGPIIDRMAKRLGFVAYLTKGQEP